MLRNLRRDGHRVIEGRGGVLPDDAAGYFTRTNVDLSPRYSNRNLTFAYDKTSLRGLDALEEQRHYRQLSRNEHLFKPLSQLELEAKTYLRNLYGDRMGESVRLFLEQQIWGLK